MLENFASKLIATIDGCWLWLGSLDKDGYGCCAKNVYGTSRAHRAAYALFNGPLLPGALILHSCDRPGCVFPGHLRLGTAKMNAKDAVSRGRTCRGEKQHNAKLTSAIVREIRSKYIPHVVGAKCLAKLYGVNYKNVQRIIKREIWSHV